MLAIEVDSGISTFCYCEGVVEDVEDIERIVLAPGVGD